MWFQFGGRPLPIHSQNKVGMNLNHAYPSALKLRRLGECHVQNLSKKGTNFDGRVNNLPTRSVWKKLDHLIHCPWTDICTDFICISLLLRSFERLVMNFLSYQGFFKLKFKTDHYLPDFDWHDVNDVFLVCFEITLFVVDLLEELGRLQNLNSTSSKRSSISSSSILENLLFQCTATQ